MEPRTDLERAEGAGVQWEISRGQDDPDPASDQQAREEREREYGPLFSLVHSGGASYILQLSS